MASPSGVQLSPAEQKDLDKFIKYLSLKAVQVVVQSRLGDRLAAPSNPDISQGTTWFNLAVKDSTEVQSEARRSLSGSIPSPGLPLVCEVSLKTAEGDSLVLEVWRLAVVAGGDPGVKVTHQVYNRMSLLLKSLVTVARVTPAYKLSRRQGVDSYVICYRVMLGDPSTPPDLGEGALTARVGQVTTPVSTIVCCVDYRTNMTITPRHTSQPILVKSDHFDTSHPSSGGHQDHLAPGVGHHAYHGRGSGPYKHSDCESSDTGQGGVTSDESQDAMRIFATSPLDRDVIMYRETGGHRPRTDSNSSASSQDRFKIGAFAGGGDAKVTDNLPSLEEELAGEPLLQLVSRVRPHSTISVTSGETVSNTSATDAETQFHMSSDSGSKVQLNEVCIKTNPVKMEPDQGGARPKLKSKITERSISVPSTAHAHESLSKKVSSGSLFGGAEIAQDFVMIDLKTPFAQTQTDASASGASGFSSTDPTLGSFFKDVSAAPQLNTLTTATGDLGHQLQTWSSQLDTFETRMQEYDDLLNQMGSGSEAETDQ